MSCIVRVLYALIMCVCECSGEPAAPVAGLGRALLSYAAHAGHRHADGNARDHLQLDRRRVPEGTQAVQAAARRRRLSHLVRCRHPLRYSGAQILIFLLSFLLYTFYI